MRRRRSSSESPGNSSITSSTTYGLPGASAAAGARLVGGARQAEQHSRGEAGDREQEPCTARTLGDADGSRRVKAVSRDGPAPETLIAMARTDFVERSPLTRDALAFAATCHAGQTRDADDVPFVTHPVEVACLLHEAGYSDEVVAAGVLHDVLEDTDAERSDLEAALRRRGGRAGRRGQRRPVDRGRRRAQGRAAPPGRAGRRLRRRRVRGGQDLEGARAARPHGQGALQRSDETKLEHYAPAWRCSPS